MKDPRDGGGIETGRSMKGPARSFYPALARLRLDPVLAAARETALSVATPGEVYLVGGVLRNLALGVVPRPDYDFVLPGAMVEGFAMGMAERLGGTPFLLDRSAPSWRVAVKDAPGRAHALTVDVSPLKGSIGEDLADRDFTVNALALSVGALFDEVPPGVLDPCGGFDDAGAGVLRAVSARAFVSDPLRCMRAVRLAQEYGMAMSTGTEDLARAGAPGLARVSPERIRDELAAIFTAPGTAASVERLYSLGITDVIAPELSGWEDVEGYGLLEHTLAVIDEAEGLVRDVFSPAGGFGEFAPRLADVLSGSFGGVGGAAVLKLAAMLHDAGKAATLSRDSGRLRFIGHDHEGSLTVKGLLKRLRFSNRATALVSGLVRHHHRVFTLAGLERPTSRARSNLFRAVGPSGGGVFLLLLSLADARATRQGEDPGLKAVVMDLLSYYYGVFTKKTPPPVMDGRDVMRTFDVPEGPEVGEILALISDGVDSGAVSTRDEAVEYVRARRGL